MKDESADTTRMPSADAARRIDLACDQFENSLAAERDPNLQQYLRRFELSLQPILLRELLLLKWEHDAGQGQQISLQHYLQSFPAHQALIVRLAEEHHPNLPFCDWNPKDQFGLGKLPGATASRWMHVGYRIERQLASGGMGRVLLARENDTGRLVALKVLRTDLSLSQRGMERFRAEVQALRRLQHPNIVHVYEINIQHEEPFYTMEYCRAGSLADFLKTQQLTVRESAQLIETLARAVHLAHQKGIVHRDLKPGNVLLQEASLVGRQESGIGRQKLHQVNSGTASFSSRFIPKLADFGLAKDLSSDTLTQTGGLLGSLPYMAPEQVGSNQSIGIGVDVHALGVILYQCLTGKNPFARATTGKTIQTLLAETATTPSRIKPSIPADLSAICTCCLEKNPADRYPSALELAEDLQRFLNYQPTQARPLSAANQLFRWGRRHPQHLAVLLAIGCCLAAFVIGLVRYNGQLRDLNQKLTQSNQQLLEASARAEASELYSRRLQYGSDIRLAGKYFYEGDLKTVYDILSTYVPTAGERDLRGSEWYFLARAARPKGYQIAEVESPLYCVCLSPNHQLIATAGQDAIIRIYDSGSGRLRTEIESGQVEVNSLAFSSDSRRLASAGDDGTLCVWGVAAANLLHKLDAHEGIAYSVAFVADTYELISGGNDGRVRHWKEGQFHRTFHDHVKGVEAIAVAPNGEWFVSCGKDGQVYLRNIDGELLPMQQLTGFGRVTCTDISSDSNFLAIAQDAESKVVSVLDVSSMKMCWSRQQPDSISSVEFSPDGTRLLTSDKLGNCRIWQLGQNAGGEKQQNPNFLWQSDSARCFSAIFDAEGEFVFTVGQQGRLTKWQAVSADSNILLSREQPTEEQVDGKWQQSAYISALFLDEDRELVVVAIDGLYFIDRESGATEFLHHYQDGMRMEFLATPQNDSTAFFVSSSPLLEPSKQATSFASKIQRWDARSRSHQTIFASGPNCSINDLSCSPSGSLLAAVVEDRKTRLKQLLLIQPESGKVIREFPAANGTKPRFTHDGGRLVYGAQRNLYSIDLEGNSDRTNNNAHQNSQVGLAISCDDRWLATCDERVIRIWHLDTLEPHATLLGHQALITSLEFSRDGRTLFSGSIDGTVKAWGVQTGQSLLDLHRGSSPIIRITISQDGNQLAVLEDYATVRVYYVGRD